MVPLFSEYNIEDGGSMFTGNFGSFLLEYTESIFFKDKEINYTP